MRRDAERLRDILEAITRIEEKTKDGRGAYDRDEMVRVWVIHHLEMMGEAARALSEESRAQSPEVPWTMMGDIRNRLAHEYFRVDEDIVWGVVEKELPKLKKQVAAILKRMETEE